jgi:hypothetical protein
VNFTFEQELLSDLRRLPPHANVMTVLRCFTDDAAGLVRAGAQSHRTAIAIASPNGLQGTCRAARAFATIKVKFTGLTQRLWVNFNSL